MYYFMLSREFQGFCGVLQGVSGTFQRVSRISGCLKRYLEDSRAFQRGSMRFTGCYREYQSALAGTRGIRRTHRVHGGLKGDTRCFRVITEGLMGILGSFTSISGSSRDSRGVLGAFQENVNV